MYKNFIAYRGGSSAGVFLAPDIYKRLHEEESIVGRTYFSLEKEDSNEVRNFLNDPHAYLGNVTNFIVLLTKDFFDGFIINDLPNPNSVTRIEIDEALKNPELRFILVMFPDFSWTGVTNGRINQDILKELWGEEAKNRIVGTPAIQYVNQYKERVIEEILYTVDTTGVLKKRAESLKFDIKFKLESTPSVLPKRVFCGREKELSQIEEMFDNGERIIFLQGIGGIGKTEIAKQYAKRHKSQYDTVIYATYNNTIVELVSSQTSFKIDPQFPRQVLSDGTQESDISFFKRKLDLIKEITNERTLIIIDNFDVMDDEYFSELTNANYKLLITTRCDYSKLYPTIKIEPLDSLESLKNIFLQNYDGYMVDNDDPNLEELIELVNRHTYTIELIAQHMENSGQTVEEMIDVLKKQGIVSLNEAVRSSMDKSQVAYENLLRMFKVFDLNEEDKYLMKILSLMPLSGVDVKDLKNWLGVTALKTLKNLENRSWTATSSNGVALHPIVRDVVRHKLPINEEEAASFLKAFNETIKEEKSWHYTIGVKSYYADITSEILSIFNKLNEHTLELYRNAELLFSFGVKPGRAIEIASRLYDFFKEQKGESSFMCGYYAFQAGWTYLFNFHLVNSLEHAKEWFKKGYQILSNLELNSQDEYAVYGHLLTHLSRIYLITFEEQQDEERLAKAKHFAEIAVNNAEKHFDSNSPYYSRKAVAYMQLAEAYIASKDYEKALSLVDDAYDIMFSLFGEDDPDTLNVSSRKSAVLYNMGRYQEALEIGQKNIDTYTRFYGELNYLRFEQLVIVLKCYIALGDEEKVKNIKENVLKIASQLLAEDSKQLNELKAL